MPVSGLIHCLAYIAAGRAADLACVFCQGRRPVQDFTDGRRADSEVARDLFDVQPLPPNQLALENLVAQQIEDLTDRLGWFRRLRAPVPIRRAWPGPSP